MLTQVCSSGPCSPLAPQAQDAIALYERRNQLRPDLLRRFDKPPASSFTEEFRRRVASDTKSAPLSPPASLCLLPPAPPHPPAHGPAHPCTLPPTPPSNRRGWGPLRHRFKGDRHLRDYQALGYTWLLWCWANDRGCILVCGDACVYVNVCVRAWVCGMRVCLPARSRVCIVCHGTHVLQTLWLG